MQILPVLNNLLKNKYFYLFVFFAFITVRFLPYFILGENAHIIIHDNIEVCMTWFKVLSDEGYMYKMAPSTKIKEIFNGELYRNTLYSSIHLTSFIFYCFTSYWGYLINMMLSIIVGYVGVYLLCSTYILNNDKLGKLYASAIAGCFIMLPFYTIYNGASVTGIPLILFLFLNFRNKKKLLYSYIALAACSLYTSLMLSGMFLCFLLSIWWLYIYIKEKQFNKEIFLGLVIFSFFLVLSEINLILFLFSGLGGVNHRSVFDFSGTNNISECLRMTKKHFLAGQYHSPSFNFYITLFVSFVLLFVFVFKRKIDFLIVKWILLIGLFSFLYGFWKWELWNNKIMNAINLSRFSFLNAPFWYIVFAIAIAKFNETIKYKGLQLITVLFLLFQFKTVYSNNKEYSHNVKKAIGSITGRSKKLGSEKIISYKEFFSETLFSEIKKSIPENIKSYNVASIGIVPNIALYNGFSVIDSYQSAYPLSYKLKFRKIIEKELEKDKGIRNYFDGWGSRCYIFSSVLKKRFNIYKFEKIKSINIQLNHDMLKELNCKYIFSTVYINNCAENGFQFMGAFTNNSTPYEIKLYKVF